MKCLKRWPYFLCVLGTTALISCERTECNDGEILDCTCGEHSGLLQCEGGMWVDDCDCTQCVDGETQSCNCGVAEGVINCIGRMWTTECNCPDVERFEQACRDAQARVEECEANTWYVIDGCHRDIGDEEMWSTWECYNNCTMVEAEVFECVSEMACHHFDNPLYDGPCEEPTGRWGELCLPIASDCG